jgi:hypothetical protein
MKKYLILLALPVLFSCGTVSHIVKGTPATATTAATPDTTVDVPALQDKLTTDLTKAIADATAAKDLMAPQRVKCYTTILSYVPQLPSLTAPNFGQSAGVFDTFEQGAELAENTAAVADYQIPPEMRAKLLIDCGPLGQAARDLLLKFNLKLARVAGTVAILPK